MENGERKADARKNYSGRQESSGLFLHYWLPTCSEQLPPSPSGSAGSGQEPDHVQLHVTWISAASDQNSWCSGTSSRAGAGLERLLQAPRAAARSVTAGAHEGPSAPTGTRRASSVLPTPSGSRASPQRGAAAPSSVCGD